MTPERAARLSHRGKVAAAAFEEERYGDARSILSPIVREVPTWIAGHELLGMTLYRLGHYRSAAKELEIAVQATSKFDLYPMLADCYRAQKNWMRTDELWSDLREASPDPEVMNEGRLVAAGALMDRGRTSDAIRLLERGWKTPKRPKEYQLRRAYALADAYERAGFVPRARTLFLWIQSVVSDYADVSDRIRSL